MLVYQPGSTVAHRLDPRSKLLFQAGFAVAVFTSRAPTALALLTLCAGVALALSRLSSIRVLRSFRFVLLLVAFAPLVGGVTLGPPWFVLSAALDSLLAGYQVVLVLLVAGVYVHSTPVRETRAAIQRHVPGRFGQLLGVGVGLVFRLVPVVFADLRRGRDAIRARGGETRPVVDRTRRIAIVGLRQAFRRVETLSLALRARCFAWNPTLPKLAFSWLDVPVLIVALLLGLSVFL